MATISMFYFVVINLRIVTRSKSRQNKCAFEIYASIVGIKYHMQSLKNLLLTFGNLFQSNTYYVLKIYIETFHELIESLFFCY